MRSPGSWNASVLIGHLVLVAGCAHRAETRVVAVMPVDVLGTATESQQLRQVTERAIAEIETFAATPSDQVLGAVARRHETPCAEPCLATVGAEVGADVVLALTLGGFGQTRVIRSRVLDVETGIVVHDSEEAIEDVTALDAHAVDLARRLFPPPEPPWFRRGWFIWTAVGVVVVGAAVTAAVLLTRGPPDPRVVHVGDLD